MTVQTSYSYLRSLYFVFIISCIESLIYWRWWENFLGWEDLHSEFPVMTYTNDWSGILINNSSSFSCSQWRFRQRDVVRACLLSIPWFHISNLNFLILLQSFTFSLRNLLSISNISVVAFSPCDHTASIVFPNVFDYWFSLYDFSNFPISYFVPVGLSCYLPCYYMSRLDPFSYTMFGFCLQNSFVFIDLFTSICKYSFSISFVCRSRSFSWKFYQ